jgi:hypothetical protein
MSSMIASAMAIYTNLQSKDRQGFLSQPTTTSATPLSSTPMTESSSSDIPLVRRAKKATTEKDTQ